MKKIFLFAAVTAVALSSCSKDEVTSTSMENQAIGFGVYSGISTKGSETTSLSVGDKASGGFGLLAYYQDGNATSPVSTFAATDGPNFMYNQEVIGDGVAATPTAASNWSYDPVKYWPTDTYDRISFFAYAPYADQSASGNNTVLSANNAATTPTITFTIDGTASSMVDLVAGQTMLQYYDASSNANNLVSLNLRHQLSRVTFSAITNVTSTTNGADDTFVVVKDMKITGTKTENATVNTSPGFIKSNTYTFDTTTSNNTVDVSSSGSAAGNGTWGTGTAYEADYSLSTVLALETKDAANYLGYSASPSVIGYGEKGVYVKSGSATSTSLFNADQYLFLIPPTATGIAASADTSDVEVSITYDIVSVDSKLAKGYIAISNTVTFDLSDSTLIQGKAYNYILKIGLNEVTVSAEVVAWDEDQTTGDSNTGDDYTVEL